MVRPAPRSNERDSGRRAPDQRRLGAVLVPSHGMARLRDLEAFLPECDRLLRPPLRIDAAVDGVVRWGAKPTPKRIQRLADQRNLAWLTLEDGFLRSVGLGERNAPPISLVVDDLGVYYDATRPSRLEALLAQTGWETPELMARAQSLLDHVIAERLSKTNGAPPLDPSLMPPTRRRRVLIVDQSAGDLSIRRGLAGADAFERMLATARLEEPNAELIVRRHPAVLAGLKQGCLSPDLLHGCRVLDADCAAADVLDRVDAVYTVTSLLGFEAMIRGLPVRCFGAPFYAGWFATRDEVLLTRRGRRRSPLEIFAAATLLYARYVDPLTGQACEAETAVDRLVGLRAQSERNAGYSACVGFSRWARPNLRALLHSERGQVAFFDQAEAAAKAAARAGGRVICPDDRESPGVAEACQTRGASLWRLSGGFPRSRDLGRDLQAAASAWVDDLGTIQSSRSESRLERLLAETEFAPAELARAAALRRQIIAGGLSQFNLGGAAAPAAPQGAHKVLILGQGRRPGRASQADLELISAVRRDQAEAFVIFRPHPDAERDGGGGLGRAERTLVDRVDEGIDLISALDGVDCVATMNSMAGFEALIRGRAVITYGDPFYAGWGLTTDLLYFPRRRRRLSLDELICGALIRHSLWIDPETGLPCPPEFALARLAAAATPRSAAHSGRRRLQAVWRALVHTRGPRY